MDDRGKGVKPSKEGQEAIEWRIKRYVTPEVHTYTGNLTKYVCLHGAKKKKRKRESIEAKATGVRKNVGCSCSLYSVRFLSFPRQFSWKAKGKKSILNCTKTLFWSNSHPSHPLTHPPSAFSFFPLTLLFERNE